MYNLIVTGAEGAWANKFYKADRSRFLEFTTDELASTLKPLTPSAIEVLKSIPCLFAYEAVIGGDMRIGRLKEIRERGRDILIEFEFDDSMPPLAYATVKPIAELLDIRDWEMNRTHWAVKDEDLIARLRTAELIPPTGAPAPRPQAEVKAILAREADQDVASVSSVQEFIDTVLSKRRSDGREIFYRGHSARKRYKLEPSLFRTDKDGNYLYLDNEDLLYRELLVINSREFEPDVYTLDRLVRMQHYSLPTRLLDITSNPLIALYFACKGNFGKKEGGVYVGEEEGEVILFSLPRDRVKYFDSDSAACIANLARLPKVEKDRIDFSITDIVDFNEQMAIRRLVHFIREEKSFFEHRIDPDTLRGIICLKGKKSNDRISSQSGAFLLFGIDAVFDEGGGNTIQVDRIRVRNKASLLAELALLNINESTVFPHIENSARYVAQKYAFDNSIQPTAKTIPE
jgi:hypothetical protein